MGGASAQIIFLTQEKTSEQDSLVMNINGSPISIFSKSFLGLGQDAARRVMVLVYEWLNGADKRP